MCEICRQTPCHPQCPNADDPIVMYKCVNCGKDIVEGDAYYEINDEAWCENCIQDSRTWAEGVEYEED